MRPWEWLWPQRNRKVGPWIFQNVVFCLSQFLRAFKEQCWKYFRNAEKRNDQTSSYNSTHLGPFVGKFLHLCIYFLAHLDWSDSSPGPWGKYQSLELMPNIVFVFILDYTSCSRDSEILMTHNVFSAD